MNPYDLFVVVIGLFFVIRGFFKGIVLEISSLIGVVGGFYAAYLYYPQLSLSINQWVSAHSYVTGYLPGWLLGSPSLGIISFSILFFGVLLGISFIGRGISYILKIAFLGWVDRVFGVFLGMVKSFVFAAAVLAALTTLLPAGSPAIKDSFFAFYVSGASEILVTQVPEELKKEFSSKIDEVKKVWETRKKNGPGIR